MRKYWFAIILIPLMLVVAMLAPASAKKPDPPVASIELSDLGENRNPNAYEVEGSVPGEDPQICYAWVQVDVESGRAYLYQTLTATAREPVEGYEPTATNSRLERVRGSHWATIEVRFPGYQFEWIDLEYTATLAATQQAAMNPEAEHLFEYVWPGDVSGETGLRCGTAPVLWGTLQTYEGGNLVADVHANGYAHILADQGRTPDDLTGEFTVGSEIFAPTREVYEPVFEMKTFALDPVPEETTSVSFAITTELPDTLDLGYMYGEVPVPRSVTMDNSVYLDSYGFEGHGRYLTAHVVAGGYGREEIPFALDEVEFCPEYCTGENGVSPTRSDHDPIGDTQDFFLDGLSKKDTPDMEFRILADVPDGAPTSVMVLRYPWI